MSSKYIPVNTRVNGEIKKIEYLVSNDSIPDALVESNDYRLAHPLIDSGVIAGTYGNEITVGVFTVNSLGIITNAANIPIVFPSSFITSTSNTATISLSSTLGVLSANVIDNSIIYSKIQQLSTNNILLGRATVGIGNVEEITIGTGLLLTGTTLSATGSGAGTVTGFSSGGLSPLFTTSVATSTTTPSLTFSQIAQAQNLFFASPNGSAGIPTFRALTTADIPSLSSIYVPVGRTLTINGSSQDLSVNRTFTITTTGTANRISVSGGSGLTPTIDIDASYIGQASITTIGIITTGTWNGSIVSLGYGGSNANLTASNGGIIYSTSAAMAILAGTPTASKMLLSGASTTPTWSTSTIPTSAGATANKVLLSDGTNYILSTPTFPNASATSGKWISSDGTNWIASTPTLSSTATSGAYLRGDGTNWITSTLILPNTITANQVLWATATNTVGSDTTFTYNGTISQIGNSSASGLSIGTANPATNALNHFFIGGNFVAIGQNSYNGEMEFGLNYYYNSGFKYRYSDTGGFGYCRAGRMVYSQDTTSRPGDLDFETAPASTGAGTGVTFTTRMTLTNSGVLALGRTSGFAGTDLFTISKSINSGLTQTIVNSNAGTSAYSSFSITNATYFFDLTMFGTGWTTSGINKQSGATFTANGPGGFNMGASHASGQITCWTGGSNLRWTINSAGALVGEPGIGITLNAANIATDTTTGTKIGTSTSQKWGFFNATPIVQPTTSIATSAFVANTSGILDDSATFGGYKISQIVKAIQLLGFLA